jgi:hypothetical protein
MPSTQATSKTQGITATGWFQLQVRDGMCEKKSLATIDTPSNGRELTALIRWQKKKGGRGWGVITAKVVPLDDDGTE